MSEVDEAVNNARRWVRQNVDPLSNEKAVRYLLAEIYLQLVKLNMNVEHLRMDRMSG